MRSLHEPILKQTEDQFSPEVREKRVRRGEGMTETLGNNKAVQDKHCACPILFHLAVDNIYIIIIIYTLLI